MDMQTSARPMLGVVLTLAVLVAAALSLSMVSHDAAAMGQSPPTCPNRYDGSIVSFRLIAGGSSINAMSNPDSRITVNYDQYYTVTFVIHVPSTSSNGSSTPGTTWYDTNAVGYSVGSCVDGVGPDQNVTITMTETHPANAAPETNQTVTWYTLADPSGVSYTVEWTDTSATTTSMTATSHSQSSTESSSNASTSQSTYSLNSSFTTSLASNASSSSAVSTHTTTGSSASTESQSTGASTTSGSSAISSTAVQGQTLVSRATYIDRLIVVFMKIILATIIQYFL